MGKRTCTFDGCDRPHVASGMCRTHYQQIRDGKPLAPIRVPSNGCTVEECTRGGKIARGMCNTHYERWRRHRDPVVDPMSGPCKIDKCPRASYAHGWCRMHHARWTAHRDPLHLDWLPPEERFWTNVSVRGERDCWEWSLGVNASGYGILGVNGRNVLTHRFSWQLHNGPIADGMCVLHRCDNPPCCNPTHLFLGTRPDNSSDMVAKGRAARGSRSAHAKVAEADIPDIRSRYTAGETQKSIGADYGLCQQEVSRIVRRERWEHVV